MGEETVYVSSSKNGQSKVYHTDADCPHLGIASNVVERRRDSLFENMTECHYCRTGERGPKSADFSHYQSLVAAAKRGETGD